MNVDHILLTDVIYQNGTERRDWNSGKSCVQIQLQIIEQCQLKTIKM